MKIKLDLTNYFLRDIDEQLKQWSQKNDNKTIALINGARRTGKTHSLEYLGQNSFKRYEIIMVDELNDKDVALLMEKKHRIDNFCDFLFANFGIDRKSINNGLLIVFDEIQQHNELKETISILNKQLECRFACTGSALWIYDTNGTRATGDFESFSIYPFSFPQFLKIIGEGQDLLVKDKMLFDTKKDSCGNKSLSMLLRLYIAVGGMPQIINCYLKHKNDTNLFHEVNRCKRTNIVNTYENDLKRYDDVFHLNLFNEYKNIVRNVGRFKDITDFKDIYEKLEAMNIIILSKNLDNINSKLSSSLNDLSVKPFLLDVGILFYYLCDSDNSKVVEAFYQKFVNGKDNDDNGYLYENFVASSLVQKNLHPFFKTFIDKNEAGEEKNYELDFLFTDIKGPVVIEAKSGTNKEHKSLEKGLKKYSKIKSSYILCESFIFDKSNLQKGPHYLPFYALDFLMR